MSKPTFATVERQATRLIRQIERTEQKMVVMNRQIKEHNERLERQRTKAASALAMWSSSPPASGAHPWLQSEGIAAHGLRQRDSRLLVPMHDAAGELWNLQFIGPGGGMQKLYGARVFGLFHLIDVDGYPETWAKLGPPAVLNIAEDYASTARVHAVTGQPVAVSFGLQNLRPVALALRAQHPAARFVIWLSGPPQSAHSASRAQQSAINHSVAAATAVGGSVAAPWGRA